MQNYSKFAGYLSRAVTAASLFCLVFVAGVQAKSPASALPEEEQMVESEGEPLKPSVMFNVLPSGVVVFKGQTFPDLLSYHRSAAFKESGARCGSEVAQQRANSRAPSSPDRQMRAADCTELFTQIADDYIPLSSARYTIPVYFHVIYQSDGVGNISDQRIADQLNVLNEDYAGYFGAGTNTSIEFVLAGITRTQNDEWFTDSEADELAYKSALGMDPSRYLNVYTNDASGYLGYAYYPQSSAGGVYDGVVLLHSSVGGRTNGLLPPYDSGRTLVHEVGHYLGLHHTFDTIGGICTNSYSAGDLVVDTPAQYNEVNGGPDYGCTASTDCGVTSPIENFMNYSDDSCMDRFSPEQANRMICSLTSYRPNLFSIVDSDPVASGLPVWLLYEAGKK